MATSVCGKPVTIMKEAARQLGFHIATVRDLVKVFSIKTYRVRYSPSGRGIDAAGMDRLRAFKEGGASKKQNGVKV
jgi:hypothetical protein